MTVPIESLYPGDPRLRTLVGVIAVIAALGALYIGSFVFAPVACALFVVAVLWPVQSWLQSRLPTLLALAIVMLIVVAAFLLFASLIGWAFSRVGRSVFVEADRFRSIYDYVIEPRVSGRALAISPSVVLFAVFFWTFLWGLFGAFIGVSITIALPAFCAQHSSTQWLAEIFGSAGDAPALARTEPRP